MASFSRLVRFIAKDGRTLYGDAILPRGVTDIAQATRARVINGQIWGDYRITDEIADIKSLTTPLAPQDVGTVRALGLNYAKHARETNMPLPKTPILFYKPATALAGPSSTIPVPQMAQEYLGVDYECELVVVIGRTCKNVSAASAPSYIAGYAVGNDVSHREWQIKLGGSQWSLGKGFDGWAPFGPGIVSQNLIGSKVGRLQIGTRVNGTTVQDSNTKDMVFGVQETVSWLSRGTTLRPGDLIFMGTPEGVGMGRTPPLWLKDGDKVEVYLEDIGTCTNKVAFEAEKAKL